MGRPKTMTEAIPGIRKMLVKFRPYIVKHRALIFRSFLALFATVALKILEPWPLQFVFDHVLIPQDTAIGLPAWFLELGPVGFIVAAGLALILFIGGRALATYSYKVGFALVGNKVLTDVRSALYHHIQHLSLSYHNQSRNGDLIVRVISDIGMLKDMTVTALMPLLASVLVLVSMIGLMFWMHWQLALVALITLPLFWLPTIRLTKKIQTVSRKQRSREGAMASTAAESISAIRVVQSLSLEDTFSSVFASQNNKSLKEGVKAKRLSVKLESSVMVLVAFSTALVLGYGSYLVLHKMLTAGELLVFLAYLKSAFKPMQDFAKYTSRIAKASAAGERVISVLEEESDITDRPDAIEAPAFKGELSFEEVSFSYEEGHPILSDLSFTIEPGKTAAFVGPSGTGKSTTASLLQRLYEPVEGRIRIDGSDIRGFTLSSLRSQMSVVLQDNLLFAASIQENIAMARSDATLDEIMEAARLANAHTFISALPQGYNTEVGERGVTLSAGQRQRIAIARAAIRKAPILLLDEPTTGLDEGNLSTITQALERLSTGKTTILITHDLAHASRADIIFYIHGGRIIESGSHQELLARGGHYARAYSQQQQKNLPDFVETF